jgi:glycosyltransferase involved in cell wall biosynthesis
MSDEQHKKRLLIATDNFLPRWDGVARFLLEIIPSLSSKYEVVVIAPNFGHAEHEGYVLIQVPLSKGRYGDIRFAQFRPGLIRSEVKKADVVFTQTLGPIGGLALLSARKAGKPLISFVHTMESELVPMAVGPTPIRGVLYPFMRWYTTLMYSRSDLLLTPSESVDDQLSWQGIRTKKRVVRLGVDTKKFSPSTAKTLRSKLGIEESDVVIGQHGRLAHEKDLRTLLRAFLRVQKKRHNVKLLIVGEGVSSIKAMLDNRPGIILTGSQSEVVPYLRAMDIFVLTSLTETTCLSALEAMSVGLPVVTTPVGFVKDYVLDGKSGLFFPFHDAYKLYQQLVWLIDHPTLAQGMGVEGRRLVQEHFDWEQTITSIVACIDEYVTT